MIDENSGDGFSKKKVNLEGKVDFLDRLKYMAAPVGLAVVSYYGPEISKRMSNIRDNMSDGTKRNYRNALLAVGTVAGGVLTATSGYKLYKSYVNRNKVEDSGSE